jgi:AAA domain-containing protein
MGPPDEKAGPAPTGPTPDQNLNATSIEHTRARWAAYQLDLKPTEADGMWVGQCPIHRTEHTIRIEEGVGLDDRVTISCCPGGCTPEEIMGVLSLNGHARPPEQWTRARARILKEKFGSAEATSQYTRVIAALIGQGLAGRRSDLSGTAGVGRYQCPICGAPGDGHGLKVDVGKSQPVVLHCFTCRASPAALVMALGLTAADISRPLPEPTVLTDTQEHSQADAAPGLRFVSLADFTAATEDGARPLLGAGGQPLIAENSDNVIYGDGGAGKTTLMIDLAMHWGAGADWLGITVARPLRVGIIEDEGPRPLLRAKLTRKYNNWLGSAAVGDHITILEEPWGAFTFADERHRHQLADTIRRTEIDAVIAGPVVVAGMEGHGTMAEVRAFLQLLTAVRKHCGRRVAFLLIHHENRAGQISGAWEGAVDTLLHISGLGNGHTRLHIQKARWASDHHGKTLKLAWADNDSYQVEEQTEVTDDEIAERIITAVRENPGTGWGKVEEAIPGVRSERRRTVRDRLLTEGQLVNIGRRDGADVWLTECPKGKTARLHLPDDPTIRQLRPDSDAAGTQLDFTESGRGEA